MNTCFQKNINPLATYKLGRTETVVDYIFVHCSYQRVENVKVIPWKDVVSQHCLLVIYILLKKEVRHEKKFKSRVRLWKLKDSVVRAAFKEKVELVKTGLNRRPIC